jgi:hypothetical protein
MDRDTIAWIANKEMKLTSVERIGRSQLIFGVRLTVWRIPKA